MSRGEPELYKDKIEVSLDGRQIFYLFFGGAVIACLVFVLGVLVGKRVEARAHVDRAGTSAARDPLAALDALDAGSHPAAAPPAGAIAAEPHVPAGQMERAVADLEGAQRAAKAAASAPAVAPVAASEKSEKSDKSEKSEKSDALAKADKPKADKPAHHDGGDDPAPAARPSDDHKDEHAKVAKEEPKKDEPKKDEPKKDESRAAKDDPATKHKSRYTLQLSSFQDKNEAQSFLDSVKGAGYAPYLVEADVDGKGTFYRVRLGTYSSYDDAIDAKTSFEAKVKKVAYVTKL
jgi:DedD protein